MPGYETGKCAGGGHGGPGGGRHILRCETGHIQDHASIESDKFGHRASWCSSFNESGHKLGVQGEGEFSGQIVSHCI